MSAMRKFVPVLGGILALVIGFGLWASFRSIRTALRRRQEEALRANARLLARECGDAWGPQFQRACLVDLYFTAQLSEPSAFFSALIADNDLRVVVHSDFLKNDFQRRGALVSDVALGAPAAGDVPFDLNREGRRIFGEPVLSKGKKVGMLVMIYNDEALDRRVGHILDPVEYRMAAAGLLGVCLAVLLAAALGYYFSIPTTNRA